MGVARIFQMDTPYAAADLFLLKFTQSADVMTITHPRYAPRELRRLAHDDWELAVADFVPDIAAPTGVAAAPTNALTADPTKSYSYKVTAISTTTEVSAASAAATCINNALSQTANITNQVTWSAVTGAEGYNVYKLQNGIYGWIGRADALTFIDDNIRPDTADTPPVAQDPFASSNWPGVVALHEQRRWFASSLANPQTLWATRSGLFNNFSASRPVQDNDAITITLAANQVDEIRWMVPLSDLVVFTSGAEWILKPSSNADVLTPSSGAKPQSYAGAAHIPPIIANNRCLFVQERGNYVRDLGYDFGSDGYVGSDLSLLARHLFRARAIKDWAYAEEPDRVIWCVMSDGALLGLTYLADQKIFAWHRHATNGLFESVCTVPEGGRDVPYFVVRRTIGGHTRRFVERLRPQDFGDDGADAWRLDAAVRYSGDPISSLSGLNHLEGATVVVLADGALVLDQVVTAGAITLPFDASKVIAGLGYEGELETLALSEGPLQARRKNLARVTLRVERTRGLKSGAPGKSLAEHKDRRPEVGQTVPALLTEDIAANVAGDWNRTGSVQIKTTPGLPATILAIIPEVEVGG